MTDLFDAPLRIARLMGAAEVVDVRAEPDRRAELTAAREGFDIALEATGSAVSVIAMPALMRPGGRIVQLGMLPPALVPLPVNLLMAREIDLVGSFRFHEEFDVAVEALATGRIDVTPILSGSFPIRDANAAFELAGDRTRAIKVHVDIG